MAQQKDNNTNTSNNNDNNEDVGGFAPAKHYCSHLGYALTSIADPNTFPNLNEFPVCDISDCDQKENWVCLKCHKVLCGRYGNQHMIQHYNSNKQHCLALGVGDLSFWCYKCNDYLHHLSIKRIFDIYKIVHIKKFNSEIPAELIKEAKFNEYGYDEEYNSSDDNNKDIEIKGRNPSNNPLTASGANKGLGGRNIDSGKDTVLEEDQTEYYDKDDILKQKAKQVAELLKLSKYTVVHTGAGISTSANLPDYRGPNGVWTMKAKGISVKASDSINLDEAKPTYTHMALMNLYKNNLLNYIVSTNVDGLHCKSGVPLPNLAELHGNVYMEYCNKCGKEYYRDYNVQKIQQTIATIASVFTRFTGRICTETNCGGKLRDSIIAFGENLPTKELNKSSLNSSKADVNIVMGSSMRVQPACSLPLKGKKFVLINLQKTPYDDNADIRIWGKIDEFMQLVMNELNIAVDPYDPNKIYKNIKSEIKEDQKINDTETEKVSKSSSLSSKPKTFEETINAVDNMEKNFENVVNAYSKVTEELSDQLFNINANILNDNNIENEDDETTNEKPNDQ